MIEMYEIKINYHYLNKCDMHCHHCFDTLNKNKFNETEIIDTFESLCRITKAINLVGGEVFTEIKLLKKLINIGMKNRVALSVVTNGYILLTYLEEEDYEYVIRNVKKIGISIDSFNDNTNVQIGREADKKSLPMDKLIDLRKKCRKYNTKLKINTVVTRHNLTEQIAVKIESINPDCWKILQVSSKDDVVSVSIDEFEKFLDVNKCNIETVAEYSKDIPSSYLMVNAKGEVYFNKKFYNINVNDKRQINVNGQLKDIKYNAKTFREEISAKGINLDKYNKRYSIGEGIRFDKSRYASFRKSLKKDKNILFLDVESFTPRPSESRQYMKYTSTQIHLLYCGLIVNSNTEIIGTYTDHIPYDKNIKKSLDKTYGNYQIFDEFYTRFLELLKEHNIGSIIVSCKDNECDFLMNALYYIKKLSRKDFERISKLFHDVIDIQNVKKNNILQTNSNKISSRNVNSELNKYRSDIFLHTRDGNKDSESSHNVSKILEKVYLDSETNIDKSQNIEKIEEYCFKDIFDDYELFCSYELLAKSSI